MDDPSSDQHLWYGDVPSINIYTSSNMEGRSQITEDGKECIVCACIVFVGLISSLSGVLSFAVFGVLVCSLRPDSFPRLSPLACLLPRQTYVRIRRLPRRGDRAERMWAGGCSGFGSLRRCSARLGRGRALQREW